MFPLKPLECCFSSMLRVIVLLEGEPPSQSQISGRPKQVSLNNFPVFSTIHHSLNSDQFPVPGDEKQWICHYHASLWGWCSRCDERCWVCDRHSIFLDGQKAQSLIWPEYLSPYIWGVSHILFGDHQMCLILFFFKKLLFFSGHSSIKPSSVECTA